MTEREEAIIDAKKCIIEMPLAPATRSYWLAKVLLAEVAETDRLRDANKALAALILEIENKTLDKAAATCDQGDGRMSSMSEHQWGNIFRDLILELKGKSGPTEASSVTRQHDILSKVISETEKERDSLRTEVATLTARMQKVRYLVLDESDGCLSGDCNHNTQAECDEYLYTAIQQR